MMENWKQITEGLNKIYYVSDAGRVKSVSKRTGKETFIKGSMNNYSYTVKIENKFYYIKRLVAEMFIPNPNNYTFVAYKDGNHRNNAVDNLYWGEHYRIRKYGRRKLS